MPAIAEKKMTADEFLAWAEGREERWELVDRAPSLMAPERAIHGLTKFAAQRSLFDAIARAGSPCQMLPDGMTVRIDAANAFVPDALVVCDRLPAAEAIEVENPVIVLEVLSPSTAANDLGRKLGGYFSVASVQHYLVLDAERRVLIGHKRGRGDAIETRILSDGVLRLDPPGLVVAVADMFAAV